jgi:predicted P-loop ATPase
MKGATAFDDRSKKNQTPGQGYLDPDKASTGDDSGNDAAAAETSSRSQPTTDKGNGKSGAHVADGGEQEADLDDPETGDDVPPVAEGEDDRSSGEASPRKRRALCDPLDTNKKGEPYQSLNNAIKIVGTDPHWRRALAVNERSDRPIVTRSIRGDDGDAEYPRSFVDADLTEIRRWIGEHYLLSFGKDTAHDAALAVGAAHKVDPVRAYFDALPKWDGRPRCDVLWIEAGGAPDTKLIRAMSSKWLVSVVARTYRPGCKVDHVLVLEGAQGIGKSEALRALFPDVRWISDDIGDLTSDDTKRMIQEPAIVIFDELSALTRKEVGRVKAFVTRREDAWVDKYQRFRSVRLRRCAFAGTTNRQDWNQDATGGRRFWPIDCGREAIDVADIARERDQLWAEAVRRFKSGEAWWIDDAALQREAVTSQSERRDVDDWHNAIADKVRGRDKVDPAELYAVLGIATGEVTREHQRRVKEIMVELRYRKQTIRLEGRPAPLRGWQKARGDL